MTGGYFIVMQTPHEKQQISTEFFLKMSDFFDSTIFSISMKQNKFVEKHFKYIKKSLQ